MMKSACSLPTDTERLRAAEIARLYAEAPAIADRMLQEFLAPGQRHVLLRRAHAVILEARKQSGEWR